MKIREVSVQQINAALNDLTRDIDIKIKQIESLNNEIKNMQSKLEALTKAVNGDLTALDEAIGDNIEYINNNFVPNTRTVNGKALDQNISLTASDVGALPDSTVIPTVVNSVTSGNMNAVTSNAVANFKPATAGTADSAKTATTATRLGTIGISNIRIGSAQAKISLNQLMTWLITTKGYIPSGTDCYKVLATPWDYAGNDILQLTANGVNYELQLAGCLIEFMGQATNYNTGRFRLRIHSSPTTSFTVSGGYVKFPVSSTIEYTCNGSGYAPAWTFNTPQMTIDNSLPTLQPPSGVDNWIKIGKANTSYGLLPSQNGRAGNGHNYLGTTSWYWKYAYIDQIYGYLNGTANVASHIPTSKADDSPGAIWIA